MMFDVIGGDCLNVISRNTNFKIISKTMWIRMIKTN